MSGAHGWGVDDLRLVRVVAASGSFTAAAEALHYSQTGVSRRVAHLERTLGGPLFTRLARGVRPTPLGDVLLAHVEGLLRRLDALAEDLEVTQAGTGGRLRVGSFPTANWSLTPTALGRFRAGHPGVATTIVEAMSPALVDQVSAGALDVAVVSDYPSGTLDSGGAELIHLMDDALLVGLPRTHTQADERQLRLADLGEETWISGRSDGADTVLFVAAARAGFEPRVTVNVASWTAKLSYVAAGFGITVVPGLLAASVPPDVVVKSLSDDLPARRVFAALPANAPTAARALLDELQAEARASPAGSHAASRDVVSIEAQPQRRPVHRHG
ncbi:MAG: LysR family transcriptional regulator [Acidimicrobiales bacterium]